MWKILSNPYTALRYQSTNLLYRIFLNCSSNRKYTISWRALFLLNLNLAQWAKCLRLYSLVELAQSFFQINAYLRGLKAAIISPSCHLEPSLFLGSFSFSLLFTSPNTPFFVYVCCCCCRCCRCFNQASKLLRLKV